MLKEPQIKARIYSGKSVYKEEFAKAYGVSRKTILEWIRKGKLRVKVHRGKVWKPEEVNEMIMHFGMPDFDLM